MGAIRCPMLSPTVRCPRSMAHVTMRPRLAVQSSVLRSGSPGEGSKDKETSKRPGRLHGCERSPLFGTPFAYHWQPIFSMTSAPRYATSHITRYVVVSTRHSPFPPPPHQLVVTTGIKATSHLPKNITVAQASPQTKTKFKISTVITPIHTHHTNFSAARMPDSNNAASGVKDGVTGVTRYLSFSFHFSHSPSFPLPCSINQ